MQGLPSDELIEQAVFKYLSADPLIRAESVNEIAKFLVNHEPMLELIFFVWDAAREDLIESMRE